MNPDKIQYRESNDINLFDFLGHYQFFDDWITDKQETVPDIQVIEIRYRIKHQYNYENKFFQFGIDDAHTERNQRQKFPSWQTRQRALSECLPERFRNKTINSFWVDYNKSMLIVSLNDED